MHIRAPEVECIEAGLVEECERASKAESAFGCRCAGLQMLGLILQTERGLILQTERRAGETVRRLHDDDSNGQVALREHGFRLLVARSKTQEAG